MNNLYLWHDEKTVKYEMKEAYRAAEQSRLLREAGLSQPSLLARVVNALRNSLSARRERIRDRRSRENESFQPIQESRVQKL